MTREIIGKRVLEITREQIEGETAINETMLIKELNINSIAFIKTVVQIEDEMNISFDLSMIDIERYTTMQDLIDYVYGLKSNEAD